jgi:hypothetical protein
MVGNGDEFRPRVGRWLMGGDATGGGAVTGGVGLLVGGLFVRSWLSRAS